MKNTYLHAVALTAAAIFVAVVVFFGLPKATQVSPDPSLGIHMGFQAPPAMREDHQSVSIRYSGGQDGYSYHPGHWSQSAGKPSPKGTDTDAGTYINPVLQDNAVCKGNKDVQGSLNPMQQEDTHRSQTN